VEVPNASSSKVVPNADSSKGIPNIATASDNRGEPAAFALAPSAEKEKSDGDLTSGISDVDELDVSDVAHEVFKWVICQVTWNWRPAKCWHGEPGVVVRRKRIM